ncbi:MAG: YcgL domain-containing protein, partial [Gammaproteobacteria bacterium]|nr:YcgL domain-containing protein [Gammaproteobacteria bacterium]
GSRKLGTYLCLVGEEGFSVVPVELLRVCGPPEFSFCFELTRGRMLAEEDSAEVLENVANQGYHLQRQNDIRVEQMGAMEAVD